jgi:hypothetical protein
MKLRTLMISARTHAWGDPRDWLQSVSKFGSHSAHEQGDQLSRWKTRTKCSPTHFLSKWMDTYIAFHCTKEAQNLEVLLYVFNFYKSVFNKQSPNKRRFLQSGHPDPREGNLITYCRHGLTHFERQFVIVHSGRKTSKTGNRIFQIMYLRLNRNM